jgi:cysteine desulfurase
LIAGHLDCLPEEVLFTSGGTESDNLALRGTALAERARRGANHILTTKIEHQAVLKTALDLQAHHGFEVEFIPVDGFGQVDPQAVKSLLRDSTAVVSVIHANNEIGTINPIEEIGQICLQCGIPIHTDAVQGGVHFSIRPNESNIDLLSLGAHKFYGPKGIGVLYKSKDIKIDPMLTGGSHEFGMRPGTENIPLIIGMAKAYDSIRKNQVDYAQHNKILRDQIIENVLGNIRDAQLTGHPQERLPNHASFAFSGIDSNDLLMMLDMEGYSCASGSSCKTGQPEPSSVLLALGLNEDDALGGLRVTVGKHTTQEDIDGFLSVLPSIVERARSL